jgi:hypothetical protein
MTWGQLRLQLQTSAPDVSLDLLDEWLNTRYEQVLEATDWQGLKAHATLQTQAAYESATDTVTVTVGSSSVAGSGTAWTSAITGQRFYVPGDTVIYAATYVSGTSLTLDRPYEGNGAAATGTVYAGSSYVFMQHIYALPSDCRSVVTVLDPITGLPMESFTKDGLDRSAGSRARVGYPAGWAEYDDSPETSPPVLHQIELNPPPLQARGFPLEYLRAALAFDGGNTSGSPLPFVSSTVLLAGVRSDIALHQERFTKAKGYEEEFSQELARLLLVEHTQRRVKASVKMAPRFTRHRMARAARGYRRGFGPSNLPTNVP